MPVSYVMHCNDLQRIISNHSQVSWPFPQFKCFSRAHCHKLNLWSSISGQALINTYLRIQLTWQTNTCTLITYALSYTNIHLHVLVALVTFIRVVYKNTDQIQLVPKLVIPLDVRVNISNAPCGHKILGYAVMKNISNLCCWQQKSLNI